MIAKRKEINRKLRTEKARGGEEERELVVMMTIATEEERERERERGGGRES